MDKALEEFDTIYHECRVSLGVPGDPDADSGREREMILQAVGHVLEIRRIQAMEQDSE